MQSFEQFIADHKDEITALQILYSKPYNQRLTFEAVKELADAIEKPPYLWNKSQLWQAYAALEECKVKGSSAQRILTDLVFAGALRHSSGQRTRAVPRTRQRQFQCLARDPTSFTPLPRFIFVASGQAAARLAPLVHCDFFSKRSRSRFNCRRSFDVRLPIPDLEILSRIGSIGGLNVIGFHSAASLSWSWLRKDMVFRSRSKPRF